MLPYVLGAIIFVVWSAGFLAIRLQLEWEEGTSLARRIAGTIWLFLLWWFVALDKAGRK